MISRNNISFASVLIFIASINMILCEYSKAQQVSTEEPIKNASKTVEKDGGGSYSSKNIVKKVKVEQI